MNFENTVVKRLEDNVELSYPLIKVLRPLFKPAANKFFNLQKALKEQKIQNTETVNEGSGILMSDKYFSRLESENDIKIRERNERYLDIFETICKYTVLAPDRELRLDKLLFEAGEDYERLVPDIKILTNVLLQLSYIREIDFSLIKEQKNTTLFNPSEEFDAKYCVLGLLNRNGTYGRIKKLTILVSRKEKIFIPEKPPVQADTVKQERNYRTENPILPGEDSGREESQVMHVMEESTNEFIEAFTAASTDVSMEAAMDISIGLHCPNMLFKMELDD